MSEEKVNQGLFLANLTRDFKQLKRDRAESVAEDAEIAYKRHIEDICRALRENKRKTENLMLELAPTTSLTQRLFLLTLMLTSLWKLTKSLVLRHVILVFVLKLCLTVMKPCLVNSPTLNL